MGKKAKIKSKKEFLSSFVAMPETILGNILEAKEALETVGWLAMAAQEGASGAGRINDHIRLPAGGLASLIWCISRGLDCEGLHSVPALLQKNEGVVA